MKLEGIKKDEFRILRVMYSPAAVYIRFPNDDEWEYVIYDDAVLKQLLTSHRRNIGRLVSNLRRFDSRKVKNGSNISTDNAESTKRQQKLF